LALAQVSLHAETLPGYERLDVAAAHRSAMLAASLWYPAGTTPYRGLIGDNGVFQGVTALVGAGVADGRYPLVVLSHGSGGNMDNLGWLSAALAEQGVMVLGVNHPGSTSGDSSPRRSLDLTSRAADVSAALDALLADPTFGPHVDQGRVAAVGFSLGGVTALNLGGIVADRTRFAAYCASTDGLTEDCTFFRKGGVDPAALPPSFSTTKADPRITAVVAIDPAFGWVYTPESLAGFDRPALVINLGTGTDRWHAVDAGPEGWDARRIAGAEYSVVAPAHHFSFLGLCKPEGPALLVEEGDDPVCDDPAGVDRGKVHERLAREIGEWVRR
jgi:predicted dienelactone hydrolase